MGFKDKMSKMYTESYLNKYGDRLTQVQGNVLSVKSEKKTILWLFHKLTVTILVKPQGSKNVAKCVYRKNRWFKPVDFITLAQGHLVIIQGLKGKKNKKGKPSKESREVIQVINVRNLKTKQDLIPVEGEAKVQKVRDPRFR